MQDLKLVYDFADRFPRIEVILFPLVFVAIGLAIFYYHKKGVTENERLKTNISNREYGMVFGIFFASIASLFSTFVISINLNEYFKTKKNYDNKEYKIIEGKVQHYHPMPEGGHDSEHFDVKEIYFEYSDSDISDYGYNNATSNGGAIKENLYIRITYFNNGDKNVILKLETE
ncbi:MAG: hypothetical protein H7068_06480 [Pedobacter sp.]|nr:hypothetical protein [Chitinophagaceae bacterium]